MQCGVFHRVVAFRVNSGDTLRFAATCCIGGQFGRTGERTGERTGVRGDSFGRRIEMTLVPSCNLPTFRAKMIKFAS